MDNSRLSRILADLALLFEPSVPESINTGRIAVSLVGVARSRIIL